MKKNTVKSSLSSAPATKTATIVKPALPVKTAVARSTTAVLAPLNVKPIVPKRLATTITATIDVGYGNTVFVRGEGAGLSWEKGIALESVADDKWTLALGESAQPVVFKFLLNDVTWSIGEDYSVAPGTSITVTPLF